MALKKGQRIGDSSFASARKANWEVLTGESNAAVST